MLNKKLAALALSLSALALTACGSSVDFGDNSSRWANDGECDDPRFEGSGMAALLVADDLGRDAADCEALFKDGRIRLREAVK